MYSTKPLPPPQVRDGGADLLSPAEFAVASGISLSTVWRMLRRRELPSVKRGGKRLISSEAVVKPSSEPRRLGDDHPIWKLVGAAKSGGAGRGSSDKHAYLADEAASRR
ncbi:MAG: helix-turn-helix domain-containing protein [Myxococcaceae bacterium]|nr:helix-turn-helix domain-containing protein [Myxococcaceae bacterium]